MKELLFERGYNAKKQETLTDAPKEAQDAWIKKRDELFKLDKQMDHAYNVALTYKGLVVDAKLD